jgi:hypothetical protein
MNSCANNRLQLDPDSLVFGHNGTDAHGAFLAHFHLIAVEQKHRRTRVGERCDAVAHV